MIKKMLFIFSFMLAACSAQDITVHPSRSSIGLNESFTLEFSSTQKVKGQPDFTPLKKDFEILSTSQSNSTSIINGEVSQKINWVLELIPKQEGVLTIPSITFGQFTSPSIPIEVTATHTSNRDESLYIETEITPNKSVYAQTQLIYTIRLYRAVNVVQGSLSEVKVNDPDAMIEKIGNDVEYDSFQNGVPYVVLERKYAVYPQKEGELIFSPIVFEGNVAVRGNSMFTMQTKYKRIYSNQESVEVKPIPPPFQRNNWLAAYDVKLSEEWSSDPSRMQAGEPITWTLTITADGCLGSQIPPLALDLPHDIKQYQDKPTIQNNMRQTKVALIASQPGTLTIPEVVIKWWDLKEDRIRETKLPARTIHIEANEVAINEEPFLKPMVISEPPQVNTQPLPVWAWALIGLNAIWIIGLGYLIFKKVNIRFLKPDFMKGVKSHLKGACQANDPKQAEIHLLSWARYTFPQLTIRTITDIKEHVPEEMQTAINELNQCLYGHKKNWEGDSLWQAIKSYKVPKNPKQKTQENKMLKTLYPLE